MKEADASLADSVALSRNSLLEVSVIDFLSNSAASAMASSLAFTALS